MIRNRIAPAIVMLSMINMCACSKSDTPKVQYISSAESVVDNSNAKEINEYFADVDNWNELNQVFCELYKKDAVEMKISVKNQSSIPTLNAFGTGNLWITIDDVEFCIEVKDNKAMSIWCSYPGYATSCKLKTTSPGLDDWYYTLIR